MTNYRNILSAVAMHNIVVAVCRTRQFCVLFFLGVIFICTSVNNIAMFAFLLK